MSRLLLTLFLAQAQPLFSQDGTQLRFLGPEGGDVRSLAVHPDRPDRFFLGTSDGQLFRSNDAGEHWKRLAPGLGRRHLVIDNLHFHPNDPETLYAGAWETKNELGRLYVTRDAGESWQEIPLGRYQSAVRAVAVAPSEPSVIAVGISEGVILSEDGGSTWERVTRGYRSLYNVESLAFDPLDSNTLYVGTWRRGWKTVDRGRKWVAIHDGMPYDSDMFSILVAPGDSSMIYSSACTGLFKSINGGEQWTKLTNGLPSEAKRTRMIQFDPTDPQVVYAGTTIGLYRTRDAGQSFSSLLPNVVVNAIAVHPARPDIILIGTDDGGVYKSDDGGRSFRQSNHGFFHRQVSALAVSTAGRLLAGISEDGTEGGLFHSDDGGSSWALSSAGLDRIRIRSILPSLRSERVVLLTNQGLYQGVPGESPFQRIPLPEEPEVSDIAFSRAESGLFIGSSRGVFKLDFDRLGARPKQLKIAVYDGPVAAVHSRKGGAAVLVGTEMGVFESRDDGATWQIRAQGMPYTSIGWLAGNDSVILAGTDRGVYRSVDEGGSWMPMGQFPQLRSTGVALHPTSSDAAYALDSMLGEVFRGALEGEGWEGVEFGGNPSRVTAIAVTVEGDLIAGTLSDGIYLLSDPRAGTPAAVAGESR